MGTIQYRKATEQDISLLIEINDKAYLADYIRYGECPGYHTSPEAMLATQKNPNIDKFLIMKENNAVGAVSVHNNGEGCYYLGNLCVIPEYQHQGIGKSTIDYILSYYADLKELTLVTPADKVENVAFYTKKCGFVITGSKMDGNVKVSTFLLQK